MKATSAPKSDDARHLIWLRDELGDGFGSTPRQIAETLAEAAAFAAVIVYQVLHTIDGVAEFVIECSSVHVRIRTLAPVPWPATRDDREGLALVRAAPSVVVNMGWAPYAGDGVPPASTMAAAGMVYRCGAGMPVAETEGHGLT